LLQTVPILVVPRGDEVERAEVVAGLTDISSSAVRSASDRAFLRRVLQPEVLDYIERHRLYALGDEGEREMGPS
jgi:nicotinic acid mononucleotide adenylyltransferase